MSSYLLDTDILSLYQFGEPTVSRAIRSRSPNELSIAVISIEEQLTGWYRLLRRVKQADQLALTYQSLAQTVRFLNRFLNQFLIRSFTVGAISRYEQLVRMKLNVGRMDLRIASIALEESCLVVTRNVRDFQRIPGLVVENWAV
jgi:tRNA(fMet)-specific endonuclease VapC